MPHHRRERRRLQERQPSQEPLPDPDIDRLHKTAEERYQLDRSGKPDREKELEISATTFMTTHVPACTWPATEI